MCTEIGVVEHSSSKCASPLAYYDTGRLSQRLQTSCDVWGLTHCGFGDGSIALACLADHDEPGMNPDSRTNRHSSLEPGNGVHYFKPCTNCAHGVILVRSR